MAVPSESDFQDYISTRRLFFEGVEKGAGLDINHLSFDPTLAAFQALIRKIYDQQGVQIEELKKHIVSDWMEGQSTYGRLENALWGKAKSAAIDIDKHCEYSFSFITRRRTIEEIFGEQSRLAHLKELRYSKKEKADYVANINSPEQVFERLRRHVKHRLAFNPFLPYIHISEALSDYYFSDKAQRMVLEAKNMQKVSQSVMDAIDVIVAAAEKHTVARCAIRSRCSSDLIRAKKELQRGMADSIKRKPIIQRMDGTAKERVLAYDLWNNFRRRFRSNKIKAIYYVMNFEGVANPPDNRNLERWVAEWAQGGSR